MRMFLRIGRWVLLSVLVLVIVLGGGGYFWLRGSLPQTAGTLYVTGIDDSVEILRDRDGIPHIYARTESDALFGLGYVHAQDRLWQMEFQRRVGHGRLSEVLGDATLEVDMFLRTIGTGRAAASAWANATPTEQKVLTYYIAGINAFIANHHGRQLPIEFTLLGFEPEPWTPEDVLVWGKMMAWDLGGNWEDELIYAQLIERLGPERAAQLMPAYAPNDPIILPDDAMRDLTATSTPSTHSQSPVGMGQYQGLLAINRVLKDELGLGGRLIGSNNWVIGGARTTTGKPILANDPHLGAQIPSIWYLAHLSGGRLDAIGATLPGVPGIIIGHNQSIAWGVTNTTPDVQDLYIERINDKNEVEYQGVWEPMRIITETIKVKDQPDQVIQVRITRHGPLISDVLEEATEPLAFRWTALDEEDHILEAFNGIARARNWEQFTNALARYTSPIQNFVYADTDNNIGYYAPGSLPIRAKGDGTRPVPGWTGEYDWLGYVPFEQMPHSRNPERGWIVSANNRVTPDSYPYLISTNFAAPYRALRIVEMIEAKDKLSLDDVAAMQYDVLSLQARELLPHLLQVAPTDERSRAALELLRTWDGSMHADSAAAAVYHAWYYFVPEQIFADELGEELWDNFADNKDNLAMVIARLIAGEHTEWCDNINTPPVETCADAFAAALPRGLAHMAELQGNDSPSAWRWDRVHHAKFPHNPFDEVDALQPIFSRSIPNGGDGFTVNVASPRRSDPFNHYNVVSYRHIIDLRDLTASRYIHTTGQSGQLLDSHYSDFIKLWQRGEYLPMRYDQEAINGAAAGRLVLEPLRSP